VDPYLKLLIERGLINAKREPNLIYQTTEKGEELLGSLKAIQREIY
jgi:predicted transcriptional regulator